MQKSNELFNFQICSKRKWRFPMNATLRDFLKYSMTKWFKNNASIHYQFLFQKQMLIMQDKTLMFNIPKAI